MWQLFCFLILVHYARACDRNTGPAGVTLCLQLQNYQRAQWATCLTNIYIQQKSSHRHICQDRSRTYCWYQCMIEVHSQETGLVTNDCYCNLNQTTKYPPVSPTASLPSECYSPSGNSCNWYRNCLERKYPCKETSNAYAITYAQHFCRLYGERKSDFSAKGQKWIDGVRKCLQVALVPLLRPWNNPTCLEIRKAAFASHTSCYLNPDSGLGVPSVCDLECSQFFKIFFIIKGSFVELDTAWESLKGMWNIAPRCGIQCSKTYIQEKGKQVMKITKIGVQKFMQRIKRSSEPIPEADAKSRFAYRLGSAIAGALAWNKDVMEWLVYPGNLTAANNTNNDDIFIVLADKKALGIVNYVDPWAPEVNLDSTVQTLASAIKQGKLPLQVDGYNVWLKSMSSCSDQSCEQAQTLAVSDKPPKWSNSANQLFAGLLKMVVVAVATLMLINNS